MELSKLLILVLTLWGIAFLLQTEASTSDTWTKDRTTRNLLQRRIPESCNVERNVRWFNRPAPRGYTNLASLGACCELCQETSGCKAWVWRNIGRVCYLLDTVGEARYCFACRGGILDEQEPPNDEEEPIDEEDIDAILKKCEDDGRTAARAAAIAACLNLTNTCLPAPEAAAAAKQAELAVETPLPDVVERSCDAVFAQTCRTESFNIASEVNAPCGAILDRGPGSATRNCRNTADALRIFNDQVTELCAPSD